jgi:hypothetical protein
MCADPAPRPQVLTTGSTLICPHPTGLVTVPSSTRLTVASVPVLILAAAPAPLGSVTGCTVGSPSLPGTPCHRLASVSAGFSRRLRVGQRPVLLSTLAGLTDGTPPPTGAPLPPPVANQTKLTAV